MKYLIKKLGRDFKELWSQFLSVFMMALLSLTIFAGLNSAWTGMQETTGEYYSKTNLCDLWVNATNITENKLDKIRKSKGVKKAEKSMAFELKYKYRGNNADIRTMTFSKNTKSVLNPLTISGKKLNNKDKGIWLDKDFADAHNLKTSDKVKFTLKGQKVKMKILGMVLDPEHMYFVVNADESLPDHELHGYGYVNEKTLKSHLKTIQLREMNKAIKRAMENAMKQRMSPVVNRSMKQNTLGAPAMPGAAATYKNLTEKYKPTIPYNQIRIKTTDSKSVSSIKRGINDILGKDACSVLTRSDLLAINQVTEEIEQIKRMAVLFSCIFILLSILTMYTTMSRLINNQISLIGAMKAIGFGKGKLYLHYGLYGFSVSLVGGILGTVLGRTWISRLILDIKRSTITLPEWHASLSPVIGILLGTMVLICTMAAIFTVRKTLRMSPAEALRGHMPVKENAKAITENKNSAYEWRWVIRDAFGNKMRYIIGVIAVVGSLTLMVAGVGIYDTVHKANDDVFSQQYRYSDLITFKDKKFSKLKKEFADSDVQFFETKPGVIMDKAQNDKEENIVVMHLGKGRHVRLANTEEKALAIPQKGGIITKKLAKKLDIKKGDTIRYKYLDSSKKRKIKVRDISNAKMPQGLFIKADSDGSGFHPKNAYISSEKILKKAEKSKSVERIISVKEQKKNIDRLMDSVNTIVYILILASFLLSFVILYNLGMVNYVERSRQYATMKVLGFYMKELRRLVLKDCALTIIPGYIIGIPVSLKFLQKYTEGVSFENIEWPAYISNIHFAVISLVVIGFSILINLLIVNKVRKIKMAEALKSVE
mgnify:FL=1